MSVATTSTLLFEDRLSPHRALAGGLLLLGAWPFWCFYRDVPDLAPGTIATLAAGSVIAATGLFIAWHIPASRLEFDFSAATVRVFRRRLLADREESAIPTSLLRAVKVAQNPRSGLSPVSTIVLSLEDGSDIPVSLLWHHDRIGLERQAAAIRVRLQRAGVSLPEWDGRKHEERVEPPAGKASS